MTTVRLFAIILMMASLFITCESKKCALKNKKLESKIKLYKHDCLEKGFRSTIGCPSTKIQPKKSVIKKCKKIENSLKKCDYTCPHDGGWTGFSEWTECSADCDGGNQTRSRECTKPVPAFGGKDCEGSAEETRDCNTHLCADIEFCDKCSDDAYRRGREFASEGCWNCACLDGSTQCGCQPRCPGIPARPISDKEFCDKCSDDAYRRGRDLASEGCWNCACLDGSTQCGCQPRCPGIPARPIN